MFDAALKLSSFSQMKKSIISLTLPLLLVLQQAAWGWGNDGHI